MKRRWLVEPPSFALQAGTAADRLAISGLKAWRLREPDSGRRYTMVRLETRGGLVGCGECGPVKASDLAEARAAIGGRKATALEFLRFRFAAQPAIEAALSNACLDLVARQAGVPVYQFLGGPTRFKVRLLAKPDGAEEAALGPALQRALKAGFRAFVIPAPPREAMTRLQALVDATTKRVERFHAIAGADAEFVLDAGGTLLPGDSAAIARGIERAHPIWFDEPVNVLSNEALSRISEESVLPVGVGRNLTDIAQFQNLLRAGLVDVLRPSLGVNSLHKVRRIAAIAETHYIAVAPHHDGGPLNTLFGIHMAASIGNAYCQQVPVPASDRDVAMRRELLGADVEQARAGFAPLLNQPGLGVKVNEAALARYSEETV